MRYCTITSSESEATLLSGEESIEKQSVLIFVGNLMLALKLDPQRISIVLAIS